MEIFLKVDKEAELPKFFKKTFSEDFQSTSKKQTLSSSKDKSSSISDLLCKL